MCVKRAVQAREEEKPQLAAATKKAPPQPSRDHGDSPAYSGSQSAWKGSAVLAAGLLAKCLLLRRSGLL